MNEELKEVIEEIQDEINKLNELCDWVREHTHNPCINCHCCDIVTDSSINDFEDIDFLSIHKIILDWYRCRVSEMKKYKDSLDITISMLIESLGLSDEDDIEIITTLINDYDLPSITGNVGQFNNSSLKVLDYRIKNYEGKNIGYHKLTVWTKE